MLPNQAERSFKYEGDENRVIYSEVKKEEATPVVKEEATSEGKKEAATGRDEGVKEGLATGMKVETGESNCMYTIDVCECRGGSRDL